MTTTPIPDFEAVLRLHRAPTRDDIVWLLSERETLARRVTQLEAAALASIKSIVRFPGSVHDRALRKLCNCFPDKAHFPDPDHERAETLAREKAELVEKVRSARVISLGSGNELVAHGILAGAPCLVFAPAKEPGEPGTPAPGQLDPDKLPEDTVILRFEDGPAAVAHLEKLQAMMNFFEEAARALSPEPTGDDNG